MSDFFQQSLPARTFRLPRPAPGTLILSAALGTVIALAGCGSNLRPTTTPIVGTGPAAQPTALAFVISAPSATAQGVGTVIDYSGDTVMATAPIGPGPTTFTINSAGTAAWSLNVDGTVSNIPMSTTLQNKNVFFSTLNPIPTTGTFAGLNPVVALFDGAVGLFALDDNTNEVDVLNGSPAAAFKLVIPVDQTPVTMVGVSTASRYYVISQNIPYGTACNVSPSTQTTAGIADGIETSTTTRSSQIPVGICPVYAVGTPDTKRVFVLNRGSNTISVINSQNNAIDACSPGVNQNGQAYTCHPCLPLAISAIKPINPATPADPTSCPAPPNGTAGLNGTSGLPAVAGPAYAEYNATTQQLVVSNYDGNTINIIDVSLDEFGNDSPTFGTTYTVPVGKNPASVTVLADGSRAYVANQSDSTVSIVTLSSHSIETTLPVTGHPRTVVSTQNSLFGKVWVASPDSPYITIIRTDQDIISTTVLVQGNALDVRTSTPDGSTANLNLVSRLPGAGQPCYLPLTELNAAAITTTNCKYQDATLLTTP
jgi:DNA-binding beta-propeller fold protein YncE